MVINNAINSIKNIIYGTNDFKLLKLKIPYFPNIEYRKEIFGYKSTKYFPKTPKTNVITKIIIVLAFTKLFLKVLIIIKSVDDKNNIGTVEEIPISIFLKKDNVPKSGNQFLTSCFFLTQFSGHVKIYVPDAMIKTIFKITKN